MERRNFVKVCASAVVVCAASIAGTASAVETQVWKASDVHPLGYPTVEAIAAHGQEARDGRPTAASRSRCTRRCSSAARRR